MAAFQARRCRVTELCLAFASLWYICLASPLHAQTPRWSNNFNNPKVLKRSTSNDPSCPAGWLCEQQACAANVLCPNGEVCVDFEGTSVCVPSGTSWCAVNPSTLQGVECRGGICCHGNCYTADAVCCNNDAVQCDIGVACNVCQPGQTCTTGASTCAAGGGGSPSTTNESSPTSPPVSPPQTTEDSGTTSPPMTPTTITTTAPPATPPTTPPTTPPSSGPSSSPTVVASVGAFVNQGCFQDSPSSRVLVADSTSDESSTGMTVEKCVAFAQQNNWQYAGVESGGQCFVGNSLHGASAAPQSDCSQVCDGNPSELCGGGNRLQLYQDTIWYVPTTEELINELTQYNATLAAGQSAVQQFHNDMQQYENDLGSPSGSKSKRQAGGVLTATLRVDLENLHGDFSMLKAIQASIRNEEDIIRRLFQIAKYLDLPVPVKGAPVTDDVFEDLNTNVVDATTSAIENTEATAATADNLIEPALEQGVIPAIDTGTDIAVATSALTSIGVWGDVAAATGIFAAIASILTSLASQGSGGNPPAQTASPTSTTTTASATAAATIMVILTDEGTSVDDFDALVSDLGVDETLITTLVYPDVDFQGLVAPLNASQQEIVLKSPIVNVMVENVIDYDHDYDENLTQAAATRKREPLAKRAIVTQPNSPSHLKTISNPSSGVDTDYTYDNAAAGQGVNIYFIDTGVRATHEDFAQVNLVTHVAQQAGPTADDDYNHGTTIASVAGGTTYGVSKNANLVMVKINFDHVPFDQYGNPIQRIARPQFSVGTVVDGLMWIMNDVNTKVGEGLLQRGKAVINISMGFSTNFGVNQVLNLEVFPYILSQLDRYDIVLVTSAGNTGSDISLDGLKKFGGPTTSMIVVGGVEAGSLLVWPQSGYGSALTVRAESTMVASAGNAGDAAVAVSMGTSQAAGQVSGLAAYFLSNAAFAPDLLVQGEVSMRVKKLILASATARTLPAPAADSIACNGENYTPGESAYRDALFSLST